MVLCALRGEKRLDLFAKKLYYENVQSFVQLARLLYEPDARKA